MNNILRQFHKKKLYRFWLITQGHSLQNKTLHAFVAKSVILDSNIWSKYVKSHPNTAITQRIWPKIQSKKKPHLAHSDLAAVQAKKREHLAYCNLAQVPSKKRENLAQKDIKKRKLR